MHFACRIFAALMTTAWMFSADESASYMQDVRPLLATYCFECHGAKKQKGDLNLESIKDDQAAGRQTKLWRNVIDQIHTHEMPPEKARQPSDSERENLLTALEHLKRYMGPPDPGRVTIRRLNRLEYDYTIRDLIGLDLRTARSSFPTDDVGEGFDNIGDVLAMPPLLLEKYLEAANVILDQAIVPKPIQITTTGAQLPALIGGKTVAAGQAPGPRELDSAGEVILAVSIPEDGRYNFSVKVGAVRVGKDMPVAVIKVDGDTVKEYAVRGDIKRPSPLNLTLPLDKGSHHIAIAFANPYQEEPVADSKQKPGAKPTTEQVRKLSVQHISLISPKAKAPQPPLNTLIFSVTPGKELSERNAAQQILKNFASRAFRRPVSKEQVDRLLTIYDRAISQGEVFEEAIKYALKGVLVSPYFLYRIEQDRKPTLGDNIYALDNWELASRLSYFIWSSMPDQQLFDLAEQGKLKDPIILRKEALRMLKDDRAKALGEGFADQWLTIRNLETVQPDPKIFGDFYREIRGAMHEEAQYYFSYIMSENRSILEFIDSDYTFLNERLAKHYGINNVVGPKMRKTTLSDGNRGGVMTMASVLTVTSQPGRTSPVKRGKWILEQILGDPPPPPPAAVEPLPEPGEKGTAKLSLRQLMEHHRKDPMCASCHTKMDAIGFGFENFDAIGRWRTTDNGQPLDTTGSLPGGVTFNGPKELKAIFMQRKDAFTRNFTEKMLTYALGRGLHDYDDDTVSKITEAVTKNNYGFHSLVAEIVTSFPFTHRRLAP